MVALFVGASIPMAEKRSLARRPAYAEHQKRVSMLIPLPPRGPAATPAKSS
jgi:steroid 5-alpha reductase family enzyme